MNDCKFFGKIVSRKITTENDTDKIELSITVQKQRKSKSGVSVSESSTLSFEAWDSAAATIEHNTTVGDYLIINSAAKVDNGRVYFRINEFRIVKSAALADT
jgi:hypothetical protein